MIIGNSDIGIDVECTLGETRMNKDNTQLTFHQDYTISGNGTQVGVGG